MRYIFKCNNCNHEFEKELKLTEVLNSAKSPKYRCPNCGGSARKLISSAAIHYKGSGWGKDKK